MVSLNRLWCVRLPVPALIRNHDVITRLRRLGYLVPPGIPGFGPAMAEDDQWPGALFGQMHTDSVTLNEAVIYRHEDLQEELRSSARADSEWCAGRSRFNPPQNVRLTQQALRLKELADFR